MRYDKQMNENNLIPQTVAVIMDGNRRWAKANNLPVFEGHRRGKETLKNFLRTAKKAGVKNVIAYAFSTENWNRTKEEVSFLLDLMQEVFVAEKKDFLNEKARIYFAGDLSKFPQNLMQKMRELEEESAGFTDISLTLCVSYGGREEIVSAVNKALASSGGNLETITEDLISQNLYTANVSEPDIVIRTSGEMRLSGFLPWQSIYSELFFTKTLWPDFSEEEFLKILEEYGQRERRRGK